jgi:hypothetical protein
MTKLIVAFLNFAKAPKNYVLRVGSVPVLRLKERFGSDKYGCSQSPEIEKSFTSYVYLSKSALFYLEDSDPSYPQNIVFYI